MLIRSYLLLLVIIIIGCNSSSNDENDACDFNRLEAKNFAEKYKGYSIYKFSRGRPSWVVRLSDSLTLCFFYKEEYKSTADIVFDDRHVLNSKNVNNHELKELSKSALLEFLVLKCRSFMSKENYCVFESNCSNGTYNDLVSKDDGYYNNIISSSLTEMPHLDTLTMYFNYAFFYNSLDSGVESELTKNYSIEKLDNEWVLYSHGVPNW